MATATRTTKSGVTIKAEVTRSVRDRMWEGLVTGREAVESVVITLSKGGKLVAESDRVEKLNPGYPPHGKWIEQGAVAKVGSTYLTEEAASLAADALAEAKAAEPGSDEFQELQAEASAEKAEAKRRSEEDAEALRQMRELDRRMNDPHSDL